jgi:hypothetical protein
MSTSSKTYNLICYFYTLDDISSARHHCKSKQNCHSVMITCPPFLHPTGFASFAKLRSAMYNDEIDKMQSIVRKRLVDMDATKVKGVF